MQNPVDNYWQIRLNNVKKELEKNNFEVFLVNSSSEAKDLVLNAIIPQLGPKTIAWGGSVTFGSTGLAPILMADPRFVVINPYESGITPAESYERRRQSLLADIFFAGSNALTEDGKLVNLDGIGNRIGGINFGPKNAVLFVGRNKLAFDVESAMIRVKNIAAPINAMRLDKKTPCVATSFCQDCASPDRICSFWTITEKSFPKHRIKVILINEDAGF
jgi:hypothetical protein